MHFHFGGIKREQVAMLPLHPLFSYIDISKGVFTKLDNL